MPGKKHILILGSDIPESANLVLGLTNESVVLE